MMSDGYCDQFGKRQDTVEKYNLLRMNKILNKISKFKNFDNLLESDNQNIANLIYFLYGNQYKLIYFYCN